MTWTSKANDLSITSTTPHQSIVAGVIGRAPGNTMITFTPLDLFGAGGAEYQNRGGYDEICHG